MVGFARLTGLPYKLAAQDVVPDDAASRLVRFAYHVW
jgi:hypothetical protein